MRRESFSAGDILVAQGPWSAIYFSHGVGIGWVAKREKEKVVSSRLVSVSGPPGERVERKIGRILGYCN